VFFVPFEVNQKALKNRCKSWLTEGNASYILASFGMTKTLNLKSGV